MAAPSLLLRALKIDPFILALVATVVLASVLPCSGEFARVMAWITNAAIALLFFLHGAKKRGQSEYLAPMPRRAISPRRLEGSFCADHFSSAVLADGGVTQLRRGIGGGGTAGYGRNPKNEY